jgi:hypothetical protein
MAGIPKTVSTLSGFVGAVAQAVDDWTPADVDWYVSPWFRGHGHADWALSPGWDRFPPLAERLGNNWYNESNLLLEFKMRAPQYLANKPATDWEWLFVMQHYGLPTRLLDWTESALLALYFALRDNAGTADAAVWALNPWWLNNRSLGRREIPTTGEALLAPWAPAANGRRLKGKLPVAIKPVHSSPRIVAQKGCFTVHGTDRTALARLSTSRVDNGPGLRRWIVPRDAIAGLRRDLAIAGVTETTAFQELDGLCREIKSGFFGV